jgi:NADPH2:quinone reductase
LHAILDDLERSMVERQLKVNDSGSKVLENVGAADFQSNTGRNCAIPRRRPLKAIQFERIGGPEVIRLVDIPVPQASSGEVRIKVLACGVNFSDIMIRHGRYVMDVPFPYPVGREFSGIVDAVGHGVHGLGLGEIVFGLSFFGGAMAEYVVVPASAVNHVPTGIAPEHAAALQIQGINALLCVEDCGRVQRGETVVVHSAAGGVGGLAVQIAVATGAKVIGTASSAGKLDEIRKLGAEPVNYTKGDWVQEIKRLTSGKGADVIIDGVGGDVFRRSVFEATAHGGRVVISGVSSGQEVSLTNFQISAAHRTLVGVSVPSFFPDRADQLTAVMKRLITMVAQGKIQVRIGHTLPIEKASEAFRLIEERRNIGKVVVTP